MHRKPSDTASRLSLVVVSLLFLSFAAHGPLVAVYAAQQDEERPRTVAPQRHEFSRHMAEELTERLNQTPLLDGAFTGQAIEARSGVSIRLADPSLRPSADVTRPVGPATVAEAVALGWATQEVTQPAPPTATIQAAAPGAPTWQPPPPAPPRGSPTPLAQAAQTASPRLDVSPSYLTFVVAAGRLSPPTQSITVRPKVASAAHGAIAQSETAIAYAIETNAPWVHLSTPVGMASVVGSAPLSVTVDPRGFEPRQEPYRATLTVRNREDPSDQRLVNVAVIAAQEGGFTRSFSYDANGNLERRIDPTGAIINYTYDTANRLARIDYPDGTFVAYTYDANGNRIAMEDTHGVTRMVYDDESRLIEVWWPGINPIRYSYDKAGNLISLTDPARRTVTYVYDADNRLIEVRDGENVTTYSYDPATGELAATRLPNGVTTTYTYDDDHRFTDVVHRGPAEELIEAFHYTLNANGDRTQVVRETPEGTETTAYAYDALQRLVQVTEPGDRVTTYTYDAAGNRLTMTTPEGTTTYTYDADNRLLSANEEQFLYDANGNLVARTDGERTITYQYDFENRLIRYEDGTTVVEFLYAGDGTRLAKIVNSARTNYINEIRTPLTQVLLETNADDLLTKRYVYGLDLLSQSAE